MASLGKASETINHLRHAVSKVFEENVDVLVDKMDSLQLITYEECTDLCKAVNLKEKTHNLIDLILHKGEEACEKFLHHVEKLIPGLNNPKTNLCCKRRHILFEMLRNHETSKLTVRNVPLTSDPLTP